MTIKAKVALGVLLSGGIPSIASANTPTDWVTVIDKATYGSSGTITFNDWGYVGPAGVGANDFQVGSGFNSAEIGQIQNVLTLDADWMTSDPAKTVLKDATPPSLASPSTTYSNANMDTTVNFYAWAYTTIGGSTFDNMTIDRYGNYFVARNDMNFMFYDTFEYRDTTGTNPDETYDTAINFKPYAISDALGWCGSVLSPDPNGLSVMAGQVKFDFAFDAYLQDMPESPDYGGGTQIVPDFVMRSYGSYEIDVTVGADNFLFSGSAVGNNNNPNINPLDGNGELTDAALDPAYHNKVSFLGGGVVPKGVWITGDSYNTDGSKKLNANGTWMVTVVDGVTEECVPRNPGTPPVTGAICYQNSFAGYPFLMRADGQRTLIYVNPEGHSAYVTTVSSVPIPAAGWLFASGLAAFMGASIRRRA